MCLREREREKGGEREREKEREREHDSKKKEQNQQPKPATVASRHLRDPQEAHAQGRGREPQLQTIVQLSTMFNQPNNTLISFVKV